MSSVLESLQQFASKLDGTQSKARQKKKNKKANRKIKKTKNKQDENEYDYTKIRIEGSQYVPLCFNYQSTGGVWASKGRCYGLFRSVCRTATKEFYLVCSFKSHQEQFKPKMERNISYVSFLIVSPLNTAEPRLMNSQQL